MQQKLTLLLGVALGAVAASVLRVAVVGPVTVEPAPSADRLITIDSATFPLDPEGFYTTVPWNGLLPVYTVPADRRFVLYGLNIQGQEAELVQELQGHVTVKLGRFSIQGLFPSLPPLGGVVFEPGSTVGLRSKTTSFGAYVDAQVAFTFFAYLADV